MKSTKYAWKGHLESFPSVTITVTLDKHARILQKEKAGAFPILFSVDVVQDLVILMTKLWIVFCLILEQINDIFYQ